MDFKYKNVKKLDFKKWLLGGNSKIYAFILLVTIAAIILVLSTLGGIGVDNDNNESTVTNVTEETQLVEDSEENNSTRYIAHSEIYKIRINKANNFATIYTMDAEGEYTVIHKQFRCSVSAKIETQTTKISYKYSWVRFGDNLYGRFVEKLASGTYIHSTPYYYQDVYMANKSAYNNLGKPAQLGYIYLSVADSMWIFENCGIDTVIEIYENANEMSPFADIKYPQATTKYEPTDTDAAKNYVPETKAPETKVSETFATEASTDEKSSNNNTSSSGTSTNNASSG